MRISRTIPAALALLGLAGCFSEPEGHDYYSDVIAECGYLPDGGTQFLDTPESIIQTDLTPACRDALESILPYDESFDTVEGRLVKDKVTEAFRALLALPLQLAPENRILGVAPYSNPHICVFAPFLDPRSCFTRRGSSRNLNLHVFNYVVGAFERITYEPEPPSQTWIASYSPGFHGGKLFIYPSFWSPNLLSNLLQTPMIRAATLVHEALHGEDGKWHVDCPGSGPKAACDRDMSGPYGIETIYLQLALRGSAGLLGPGGKPVLSDWDVMVASAEYLAMMETDRRFLRMPPELEQLLASTKDSRPLGWVLEQEKISRPVEGRNELNDVLVSRVANEALQHRLLNPLSCGTREESQEP